jgi:hypothetical protein
MNKYFAASFFGVLMVTGGLSVAYADQFSQYSRGGMVESGLPLSGGTLTGSLLVPDGSLGAPSVAFSSDADGTGTGIYRSAANTGNLVANGLQVAHWTSTGFGIRPTAAASPVFTVGTAGTSYFSVDTSYNMVVLPVAGSLSAKIGRVTFCGLGPNGATPIYMSPNEGLMWGGASAAAAAACAGGSNATEGTADMVYPPMAINPMAISCVIEDTIADAGVTFTLRDDTADVGSLVTCTSSALVGSGAPKGCQDQHVGSTAKYAIAAGSAIAVKMVATSANLTTLNAWCELTYAY